MAKMNDIRFTKTNGGMGRKAANEDPISGLLMYLPELSVDDLTSNDNGHTPFNKIVAPDGTEPHDLYVVKLRYPEELENLGAGFAEQELSTDYDSNTALQYMEKAASNALVYHVQEFFRMNPEGTLYLGIKCEGDTIADKDIAAIQNYAGGALRQCGVFTPKVTDSITKYQEQCAALEEQHEPLSLIVTTSGCKVEVTDPQNDETEISVRPDHQDEFDLTTSHVLAGRSNVSFLVGCELDGVRVQQLGQYAYYGCIGTCLGAVSKAAVHECIAWVQNFPLGLKVPGLFTDQIINEVRMEDQELINDNRYIFVRTHVGNADNFFNDSHTLDEPTSDYAYIENVRTIDKACRGVRANLLPYLNSPLKVDAETGQLDPGTVAFLETTAGKALEDMEKAGELSGYRAEIDPEQNVLATSEVEVLIKNVPMGVMRSVHVKIGFTTSL